MVRKTQQETTQLLFNLLILFQEHLIFILTMDQLEIRMDTFNQQI